MSNALIIFLAFSVYLLTVTLFVYLSWYCEKLDPDNELPDSIWDEIAPHRAPIQWPKRLELNWLPEFLGKNLNS